jgi:hypothetical protein
VKFSEGDVPHTLVILHPGFARTIVLPEERESLTADNGELRIELSPESRINGRIVLPPVSGSAYSVQVQALSGLQQVEEMYHGEGDANEAGEFVIDRLRGGRYRLAVMLDGHSIWATNVDVLDVEEVTVELGQPFGPYTLRGRAEPFAFIQLVPEVNQREFSIGGQANADGEYEVTGLPAGNYRVHISTSSGVNGFFLNRNDSVEIAGDTEKDFVTN